MKVLKEEHGCKSRCIQIQFMLFYIQTILRRLREGGRERERDNDDDEENMLFCSGDRSETLEERRVGGACRRCIAKTLYSEHEPC